MIRNDAEYQQASAKMSNERERLAGHRSQLRELASRLGVHESQLSRDERNEYFGITLGRATKVRGALHVKLHSKVELIPVQELAIA